MLAYLQQQLGSDGRERVHAIYCDRAGRPLADETVADGRFSDVRLRFRSIVEKALQLGASGLLLAHNHPSGVCRPSRTDIDTTRHLARAGAAIDLELIDHLIITSGRAYSMKAGGLL